MSARRPDRPALSVVVIGRNEGERLPLCLASVRAMRPIGGPVEVLYVDSGSTDGSPERAASLGARVLELRNARPCAGAGRNAGWKAARAPLVLFLDGDTILDESFVADSIPAFEDETVAVIWGHRRELHPEVSLYNRVLDLDWIHRPGEAEICGGDALVRRSALEAVGGYDEDLIAGEEPDLCRRLRRRGLRILHVDRPMTRHDLAITHFGQYWRRAERTGHAYAEVARRCRPGELTAWQAEQRRNRRHATALLALAAGSIIGSAFGGSPLPILLGLGSFGALVLRTAARARWKCAHLPTRLLYAAHSHLQQIPIFVGQLRYELDRRRGRRRGLIEYKEATSP